MHILGLANGSLGGNSVILLKAALKAAQEGDTSITVSWIHVPSLIIPTNPPPLQLNADLVFDHQTDSASSTTIDDRKAVLDAVLDADALIIATATASHQPNGTLKWLADHILGPYADVSDAYRPGVEMTDIQRRQKKPRVAGFLAVAGSGADQPDQWSMVLPSMHGFTYPLHAKVVDQVLFAGYAMPGVVLANGGAPVKRAQVLGRNVASQVGKWYDEARFLGEEERGACPYCHLLKIEFREGNKVMCVTCGAGGSLERDGEGEMRPVWEEDSLVSCVTLKGKWQHTDYIRAQIAKEMVLIPEVAVEKEEWLMLELPRLAVPSSSRSSIK